MVIQHLGAGCLMHLAATAQQLSAPFTKRKPFRIYIGDIVGYGHHTLPERTMDEPEGVAEFMFYLLDQPPLQDGLIRGQAIKLLLQPGKGDDPHVPIQLGLTKDKGQDRNEEVRGGNADHLRGIRGEFIQHLLQDLGGMTLFTRGIIGVLRLDPAS